MGANKKAKANMVSIIGELIASAGNCYVYPDYDNKHGKKASNGWHRYDVMKKENCSYMTSLEQKKKNKKGTCTPSIKPGRKHHSSLTYYT